MPIQECACFTPQQLERPGGVAFDTNSRSAQTDHNFWSKVREKIGPQVSNLGGNEKWVMCLIQTRNYRKWNDKTGTFDFKPNEDYLVAAYLCEADALVNYKPGTVLNLWFRQQISFTKQVGDRNQHAQQFNGKVKEVKPNQLYGMQDGVNDPNFTKVFQADPGATNLSVCGVLTLIHRKVTPSTTLSEALSVGLDDVANKEKYGWKQHKTKKKFLLF